MRAPLFRFRRIGADSAWHLTASSSGKGDAADCTIASATGEVTTAAGSLSAWRREKAGLTSSEATGPGGFAGFRTPSTGRRCVHWRRESLESRAKDRVRQ